jgi:hypothetical protein
MQGNHTKTETAPTVVRLIWLSDSGYLLVSDAGLVPHKPPSLAHLPAGSYAATFVQRAYDCFFCGLHDLQREFKQYYASEYPDLRSFLIRKHDIDEDLLDQAVPHWSDTTAVGRGSVFSGGDYVLGHWLRSEAGTPLLKSMFALSERAHNDEASE